MPPVASVIVRAKNKVATIGATLDALRRQTVPVEVIVVDSGSTDGTLEVAQRSADVLLRMPEEEFTYGGALNLGAGAASSRVHMALSAHCVPRHDDWVERSVSHYQHSSVAATNHGLSTPAGRWFDAPYYQTLEDAAAYPYWGFSNHASSWRASVWEQHRFREDLPACEDKEWSWRVLSAGWTIAYDPGLDVPSHHRRDDGLRALWRRHQKESRALALLGALPYPDRSDFWGRWWDQLVHTHSHRPFAVRLFSPYRVVSVHGDIAGARTHDRLPGALHDDLTTSRYIAA